MSAPTPYFLFPGTARSALEHYRAVFGGELTVHTFDQFERTDGPGDAIAHGMLAGPVTLYAADAPTGPTLHAEGLMMSLLGSAEPTVLREWFAQLAERGEVLDPLQRRAWGAFDGQVRDAFGVTWLIGYEHAD